MDEKHMDYLSIIKRAKLAEYGPVHGSIIILPYGFQIWKRIEFELSRLLEKAGHEQVCFPLLIPEHFFDKEKENIPGLSPSNYTITRVGNDALNQPLVVRPTSELTACYLFSKLVNSFRDLPIKFFQWANIVRYENGTHPFIKGTEIQWLEGHTAHTTHESAIEEINLITDIFYQFITDYLKLPILYGEETETKKFIGSQVTRTFETITPSGKALQLAAIYDLGQLFANQFLVKFQDRDNTEKTCWTTDWGLGFRLIGALALIHSDSRGLRLPSTIAPYQVFVIALFSKKSMQKEIYQKCNEIKELLDKNGIRNKVIIQGENRFGKVIQDAEVSGIPLTLLIGDEEIERSHITLLRRDKALGENRFYLDTQNIVEFIGSAICEYDEALYQSALDAFHARQLICDSIEELDAHIDTNWVIAPWCGNTECEKEAIALKRNIRMLIRDEEFTKSNPQCIICKNTAKYKAIFAHKY